MDLKIRSQSYGYSAMQIELMVREFAAARGRHNLDTWLDGCRFIADGHKMSVCFEITQEPAIRDPKRIGNRITAFYYDHGDPSDPSDPVLPVCRLWRGRKAGLGWIVGQLVFDGDDMFIMTRDQNAGWCWFAVDEVEIIKNEVAK